MSKVFLSFYMQPFKQTLGINDYFHASLLPLRLDPFLPTSTSFSHLVFQYCGLNLLHSSLDLLYKDAVICFQLLSMIMMNNLSVFLFLNFYLSFPPMFSALTTTIKYLLNVCCGAYRRNIKHMPWLPRVCTCMESCKDQIHNILTLTSNFLLKKNLYKK